jgi:signal transduction histidine kinase
LVPEDQNSSVPEQQYQKDGFILLCDRQGKILRIIHNSFGDRASIFPEQPLAAVVDQSSVSKSLDFLATVRAEGAVFDWELNFPLAGKLTALYFTGYTLDSHLLIVARPPDFGRSQLYYDQLSRLNNELSTLHRELAKKNAILEQLNTQKNQFLGMAAHDLRTPLNVILAYSEFVLEEAAEVLSQEHLEFISIIRSSSQFMFQVIDDLLDIAQIEAGKLNLDRQPTDIISLVAHNINLNRVLMAKQQRQLVFQHPEHLPELLVDAAKIEQVLNNLITNAAKFSGPGSTVTVSLTRQQDTVIISVKDEGRGIPEAELGRLFKPFGRTSVQSTTGERSTGLGLVIVRKIVEGHQGKIWVESEVGKGSTFYFSLPLGV